MGKKQKDLNRGVYHSLIRNWLILGLIMIFFQIVIGGITRLTGSGLSITKWELVTGTFPPMSESAWKEAFNQYKTTPQYELINKNMKLDRFKFIYFWEYFHRLWARLIGFAFLIPLLYFLAKRWINKTLLKQLLILVSLGLIVALFGWIMVMSGLVDRPWVSAYKLAMHLILALFVYAYLLKITMNYTNSSGIISHNAYRQMMNIFIILLFIQLIFGAFMSGMHAGLSYPTWPKIGNEFIPSAMFDTPKDAFFKYESNPQIIAIVHFVHRNLAYILLILGSILYIKGRKISLNKAWINNNILLITLLVSQVLLGIITLISCNGRIPIFLASLHQALAIILLTIVLRARFMLK